MTLQTLQEILGWSAVINMGIFLFWFLIIAFAHDWIYRLHTRWFRLTVEQFDAIHYATMGGYKLAVIVLNVVPYFALRIVS